MPKTAAAVIAVPVTISLNIPEQFLRDVLCTAIESGSGYWAAFEVTERHMGKPSEYQRVTVRDNEADSGEFWDITLVALAEGIRRLISRDYTSSESHAQAHAAYSGEVLAAVVGDDAGQIDADLADLILQMACFGHIVYG